jgi:hypothetical protein
MIDIGIFYIVQAFEAVRVRLLSASHCARMRRAPSARERTSHAEEYCIWAACK